MGRESNPRHDRLRTRGSASGGEPQAPAWGLRVSAYPEAPGGPLATRPARRKSRARRKARSRRARAGWWRWAIGGLLLVGFVGGLRHGADGGPARRRGARPLRGPPVPGPLPGAVGAHHPLPRARLPPGGPDRHAPAPRLPREPLAEASRPGSLPRAARRAPHPPPRLRASDPCRAGPRPRAPAPGERDRRAARRLDRAASSGPPSSSPSRWAPTTAPITSNASSCASARFRST